MQSYMGSVLMLPVLGRDISVLAALSAHQLEFDSRRANIILCDRNIENKRLFLPLIRREVNAPVFDPDALSFLCEIEPKEGYPLVVGDVQREKPFFRRKVSYLNPYPLCYLHLPDRPIPELTRYFRQQLQRSKSSFDYDIMPLIDRYGTRDLLPEVLRIYQPNAGRWASAVEVSCLRFWIRCDSDAGIEALLSSQRCHGTGCYKSLLFEVSAGRWSKKMQNVALRNLSDPDPEIVAASIRVLERSGDATVGAAVASSYLEMADKAPHDTNVARAIDSQWTDTSSGARALLNEGSFRLNIDQKRRLDATAHLREKAVK
jgi:hypothetical protein